MRTKIMLVSLLAVFVMSFASKPCPQIPRLDCNSKAGAVSRECQKVKHPKLVSLKGIKTLSCPAVK